MDGHQPQSRDSQFLQIVQFGGQARDITDAVTVGIAVGVNEHLVIGAVVIVGAFTLLSDLGQDIIIDPQSIQSAISVRVSDIKVISVGDVPPLRMSDLQTAGEKK